jgi:hypothetical protein
VIAGKSKETTLLRCEQMSFRAWKPVSPQENVEGRAAYTFLDGDFVAPCAEAGLGMPKLYAEAAL